MRRNLIEATVVAVVAAGLGVILFRLPALPKVVVGRDQWTVSWATPVEPAAAGERAVAVTFPTGRASDQSVRQFITLSLGGRALRVRLTNRYGHRPLVLTRVTIAARRSDGTVDGAHLRTLDFGGRPGVGVPAGAVVTSDPLALAAATGDRMAITMAVAGTSPAPTLHPWAGQTSEVTPPGSGDHTTDSHESHFAGRTTASYWLATVEVLNPQGTAHALVALGDSLTDAYGLAAGAPTWPDMLRAQLPRPATGGLAVIDEGLAGNTVTALGCGVCGEDLVDRVIRDAVDLPGVDRAIVLAGTNDITRGASAAQIVHGLASVAAILRVHHIESVGMTIPPRDDGRLGWDTATMDPVRRAVNGWLRGAHAFDHLVDADALLADPVNPDRLSPRYDLGDGLDLNAAGRAVLAQSVPASVQT